MKPTVIEDPIVEFEPFEEDGSVLMAAEIAWRGMAEELQELHYLKGALQGKEGHHCQARIVL